VSPPAALPTLAALALGTALACPGPRAEARGWDVTAAGAASSDPGPRSDTTPPTSAATGTNEREQRSRQAVGPLVAATAAGLLLVLLALSVWTIHWGRRLRRRSGRARPARLPAAIDPWVASGQRFRQDDDTDEQGEGQ
jgi:hypothetical protein